MLLVGDAVDERASALRRAGADVRVVRWADYTPAACEDVFLVMAFCTHTEAGRTVAGDARAAGCLVYAHDAPDVSDFALPAVARRGPLSLAIATDGEAPALAGRFRRELQALLDRAGERLDAFLAAMAARRAALPRASRRRALVTMARRVRLAGTLAIDQESGQEPDPKSGQESDPDTPAPPPHDPDGNEENDSNS